MGVDAGHGNQKGIFRINLVELKLSIGETILINQSSLRQVKFHG